jgi:shikimate dehydrogenase
MTERFAVIGTPVAHSLSPKIHNAIFAHEGRDAHMDAIDPGSLEELEHLLESWRISSEYKGLAVTAPYKPLAAELEGKRSDAVKVLGVANTLTLVDGMWHIDNTDVEGFTSAVQQLVSPLRYRTFVVFGTGATARTIIYALIQQGAAIIQVIGRSCEKAEECVSIFSETEATQIIVSTVPPGKRFDCAINATTLGLSAHDALVFPVSWFKEYARCVYDVIYRPLGTTRLVRKSSAQDIPAHDGRSMLFAQAIAQAQLWGSNSSEEELRVVIEQACEENIS